jgi:hypothetical protein
VRAFYPDRSNEHASFRQNVRGLAPGNGSATTDGE